MKSKMLKVLKLIGGYLFGLLATVGSVCYVVSSVAIFATLNNVTGWAVLLLFFIAVIMLAVWVNIIRLFGRTVILGLRAEAYAHDVHDPVMAAYDILTKAQATGEPFDLDEVVGYLGQALE